LKVRKAGRHECRWTADKGGGAGAGGITPTNGILDSLYTLTAFSKKTIHGWTRDTISDRATAVVIAGKRHCQAGVNLRDGSVEDLAALDSRQR